MKLLVYSTKKFEIKEIKKANNGRHDITFIEQALDDTTAVLAAGYKAISIFSGDNASSTVLEILKDVGVKHITLRSAGYNNVSISSAKRMGFRVANAPDYSPHAIAEHAIALLLALNRKLIKANEQVHAHNFLLNDLVGFNLNGKTVGIIGTGRIGSILVKLFHAFGCRIIANDLVVNHYLENQFDVEYKSLEALCKEVDIISINIPLNNHTHYLFERKLFGSMKKGVVLVNTARGGIVKTSDLLQALKNETIAGYATDVYEREKGIFFKDNGPEGLQDEKLKELISLPNVLLTPHQAFVTKEAIRKIAETTIHNLNRWQDQTSSENELF